MLTRGEVLRILQTWLRLQDAWSAHAGRSRAEPIDAPLFVVGPPRSGTTILLELLALDPQLRPPLAWEALASAPGRDGRRRRPIARRRLELAECEQEFWADIHPEFMTMHELASDLPCECVHFLVVRLRGSVLVDALRHAERSPAGSSSTSRRSARVYRLHRRMLQTFQHGSTTTSRGAGC